ncbi:hypothetical protein LPJ66_010425, partial [Kickxella alabastrina]
MDDIGKKQLTLNGSKFYLDIDSRENRQLKETNLEKRLKDRHARVVEEGNGRLVEISSTEELNNYQSKSGIPPAIIRQQEAKLAMVNAHALNFEDFGKYDASVNQGDDDDSMARSLHASFGKDAVVIITKKAELRQIFKKRGFQVLLTDKLFASTQCPGCHSKLELSHMEHTARNNTGGKEITIAHHRPLQCANAQCQHNTHPVRFEVNADGTAEVTHQADDGFGTSLQGSLSPEANTRMGSELNLKQLELDSTFSLALSNVALAEEAGLPVRQAAIVQLRGYIGRHWSIASAKYEPGPIPDQETKSQVRESVFSLLSSGDGKLRAAAAAVVAGMARYDWPDEWPQLFSQL